MNRCQIITGDCRQALKELPSGSVHCCITSPPYWGLRDYGHPDQIGQERTPEDYVETMVQVFREVKRVLRDDGTLWLNLGDSFSTHQPGKCKEPFATSGLAGTATAKVARDTNLNREEYRNSPLPEKNLIGIPWRVAFALQRDGWYLRSDIIWHKPNPMPESVTDRPTKSHEYLFLMSKAERYFYDAEAIKEPSETEPHAPGWKLDTLKARQAGPMSRPKANGEQCGSFSEERAYKAWGSDTRNKRTVWTVPTSPYSEAHFATFPPGLIKPCILAGTSAKGCCPKCGAPWERTTESKTTEWKPACDCFMCYDYIGAQPCTVLDPFGGSGTTGQVAIELGRRAILIELNPKYMTLIENRTHVTPGLPLA